MGSAKNDDQQNGYKSLSGGPSEKQDLKFKSESSKVSRMNIPVAPSRRASARATAGGKPLQPALRCQDSPQTGNSPRWPPAASGGSSTKASRKLHHGGKTEGNFSHLSTGDVLRAYADYRAKRSHTWVILPNSPFLVRWDFLMLGALLFIGILQPVIAAFNLAGPRTTALELLLSTVFLADTGLMFLRAINQSTREGRVLITDSRELALRYIRGSFLLDFVGSLPFSVIFGQCRWALLSIVRFARMSRVLTHIQSATGVSFSILNLSEFSFMSCLVLHWIACAWVAIGLSSHDSWLTAAQEKLTFFEVSSRTDMYLLSFYWSVTVLSSVGFGDITPVSREEYICSIICMGIGGGVWAYIVGSVCSMTGALDKHRITFEDKMNEVDTICAERKLPGELQERVKAFFQNAREFLRMQEYHDTINELSPALKGEVVMWMYGTCFRKVWYFDVVDKQVALVLLEGMKPFMYAPQELVVNTVDNVRALLFLRSGLCVRKNMLLAPGSVWGTDVILGDLEHEDTEDLMDPHLARTVNFVFVLKLSKRGIDHCCSIFPSFGRRIRKAHVRMLCWRSVIAASRAAMRYDPGKAEPLSRWEALGFSLASKLHEQHEDMASLPSMHHSRSWSDGGGGGTSPKDCAQPRHRLQHALADPGADAGMGRNPSDGGTRRTSEIGTDEDVGLAVAALTEEVRQVRAESQAELGSMKLELGRLSTAVEQILQVLQKQ
mmetsp:Transcript_26719/g.61524  ORF Transcript_26719/g.61524 Transcript_26719/m.61524 type:complete len:721 (+) Transcript_26719:105-2267(+)